MKVIKKLINKFIERIQAPLNSEDILLEMNGVVLTESNDKDFDLKSTVINEVQEYCAKHGVEKIDKVVIISIYDADMHNLNKRFIFDQRTKSESESKIIVVREGDKVVAQVFFGEYIEIHGDN
jgi:hypothetical protein